MQTVFPPDKLTATKQKPKCSVRAVRAGLKNEEAAPKNPQVKTQE